MRLSGFSKTLCRVAGGVLMAGALSGRLFGVPGEVDLSFDPGSGLNGRVNAIEVQPDDKVLVGGEFTTVHGLARAGIARLHADGSGDDTFNPILGATSLNVSEIIRQPDGKVLVCGQADGQAFITRLNADGTTDSGFASPAAPHPSGSSFSTMHRQTDGKVVLGGGFPDYYWDPEGGGWQISALCSSG